MKIDFFIDFRKNTQMSHFIKIRPVGTELFRADGRTMTFRNFAEAPKKTALSVA
jgi:hypothetical protein